MIGAALLAGCGGGDETALDSVQGSATATAREQRSQALAATFSWCAAEGTTCSFSGTREVRYGTTTQYNVKVATGSIACNNSVFGDPAPGTRKGCYVSSETTSGSTSTSTSTSTSSGSFTWCAPEGGRCSFSGTATVRYGTTTRNVTRSISNGTTCSNSVFGDPAPGQVKACWYSGGTSSSTSTPTAPSTAPATSSGVSQIYALRNQWVSGMQGQYTTITLRFYAVPMGVHTKAFVHLYNSSGGLAAATGHHLRYIPSAGWSGYVQANHEVYIPSSVPVGQYRISVGLYLYTSPYTLMMHKLAGNGVSKLQVSNNNSGYHVGTMQVTQATRAAVADQRSGAFTAVQLTGWN